MHWPFSRTVSTDSHRFVIGEYTELHTDKIFVGGLAYFGLIVPAYGIDHPRDASNQRLTHEIPGYAYFANVIIKSYGYSGMLRLYQRRKNLIL